MTHDEPAWTHVRPTPDITLRMPDELALLPTEGVAAYVARFAAAYGVTHRQTALDAWAETVTRLSGDDVRSDATCDVLVALKRRGLVSGAQMARLLVSHLRECKARGSPPTAA